MNGSSIRNAAKPQMRMSATADTMRNTEPTVAAICGTSKVDRSAATAWPATPRRNSQSVLR